MDFDSQDTHFRLKFVVVLIFMEMYSAVSILLDLTREFLADDLSFFLWDKEWR